MTYDVLNRLTGQRYSDGSRHTLTYDAVGNRTGMADPTGRTTLTFDARRAVSTATNPASKRITYSYDAVGRRGLMVDPDGGRFTYAYDAAGRLTRLVNPNQERTTLANDVLGRQVRQQSANGVLTTHAFDAAGQLTGLVHAKSDGTLLSRFTYSYDPAGNRLGMREADGTLVTWSYDATYQLTREQRSGVSGYDVTLTYDGVGNRLKKIDSGAVTTYAYDAANELSQEESASGRTTYSFDAAGNRVRQQDSSGITTYTWDEDNRLTEAILPSSRVTFAYNALGKRVSKQTSGGAEQFIYDGNRLLATMDSGGVTQCLYTATNQDYGDLVSESSGTASAYHHYDALGSTRLLTASDQTLTDDWIYRAFGEIQSHAGPSVTAFTYVGQLGYYRDLETGLYLLSARYYGPADGQFLSEDPILYRDGMNLYGYVHGDPVAFVDPSGLKVTVYGVVFSYGTSFAKLDRTVEGAPYTALATTIGAGKGDKSNY